MKTKSGRPLKWKTITKRYPNQWVVLRPVANAYPYEGIVLWHSRNRDLVHKKFRASSETHVAISYTGDLIKLKKNETVLLSVW